VGGTEDPDGRARPRTGRRREAEVRRALDPDALAALEEERDFLLASLADLEREHAAGDVDDVDHAQLKDDYTARTAAVLRALEERQVLAGEVRARRSWRGPALTMAVVVLVAALGGVLLARTAGTRDPGEQLSGDIPLTSRDLLLQGQQLTGQAQQELSAGDPEAALEAFQGAIDAYQRVLEIDPGNAQALTYQGWLLHNIAVSSGTQAGAELDQQARARLDEAIASDPAYPDARVFRAILLADADRFAEAEQDLAALDALGPDAVPSYMEPQLAGLRERIAAGLAGTAGTAGTTAPAG
jgi:cytochrome c-type biogenesis protein CcmH/NrfG